MDRQADPRFLATLRKIDGQRVVCNWIHGCPIWARLAAGDHEVTVRYQAERHVAVGTTATRSELTFAELSIPVLAMKPAHVYVIRYTRDESRNAVSARVEDLGERPRYGILWPIGAPDATEHFAEFGTAPTASVPMLAASRHCGICPEMVSIPGGEFMMGTQAGDSERGDNELPQRLVRVRPFALGKTEVTVAQWREFARDSGYQTQAERNVHAQGCFTWEPIDAAWAWREGRSWREPGWSQKDSEPVVCISWVDAWAYLRWLNQHSGVKGWRLPSEAEWEYAARAGSTTRRPWADNEVSCRYANGTDRTPGPRGRAWTDPHSCRDGYWFTAPVGSYRPNAWGLHDVLGNVWEWVQDCHLPYASAPSDGSAHETNDCKGRVVRGGAWDEPPTVMRSAERFWMGSANRNNNIGLRVARTLPR